MRSLGLALVLFASSIIGYAQSGLVAYYPFSGNFLDSSGNNLHAFPRNGTTFGKDRFGHPDKAAKFDGVNDWAYVKPSILMNLDTGITISMWYKPVKLNQEQTLVSKSDTFNSGNSINRISYKLTFGGTFGNADNRLFWETHHQGGCIANDNKDLFFSDSTLYDANQNVDTSWRFIAVTFQNGVKTIYENGGSAGAIVLTTGVNVPGIMDACPGGMLKFGYWWNHDTEYFEGLMDDVRIYDRALTINELDSLYTLEDPALGVANLFGSQHSSLNVAPNPATDVVTISGLSISGPAHLTITDAFGKTMASYVINKAATSYSVPVSSFAQGIYFLHLKDTRQTYSQKFLKQ